MERWNNRVAVVTAANSDIGLAISLELIKAGMIVVGTTRNMSKLEAIREQMDPNLQSKFLTHKCDVADENSVKALFNFVDKKLGGVHVLINNAGVFPDTELLGPDNTAKVREALDTNIMGLMFCVREAFRVMRLHHINDGHIFCINSICGLQVLTLSLEYPSLSIYPVTKNATRAMIDTYRQDFLRNNTKTRITGIYPGAVDTKFFPKAMGDILRSKMAMLKPEDLTNSIIYALSAPPDVQIHEIVIKPLGEVV